MMMMICTCANPKNLSLTHTLHKTNEQGWFVIERKKETKLK